MSLLALFVIAGVLGLLPFLYALGLVVGVVSIDLHAIIRAAQIVWQVVRPVFAW